jgi:hypothetical protein
MSRKQVDPAELRELTDVFRKYGADDPDAWAKSQLEEGIPQLAIFCFTKAIWEGVVDENDSSWIDREIEWAKNYPNDPCAQVGPALEEMLAKGVNRQTITDLVRVMQYGVLYHICSLIDGSQIADLPVNNWRLHQMDENGRPIASLQGLHEVLLGMDPTKREMRPKASS